MGNRNTAKAVCRGVGAIVSFALVGYACVGCAAGSQEPTPIPITVEEAREVEIFDRPQEVPDEASEAGSSSASVEEEPRSEAEDASAIPQGPDPDELRAALDLTEDYRSNFVHGEKGPEHQKYIVLHDTEGSGTASSVVDWWDGNGAGVAAHFIVNRDGTIVQAVPLDKIAHHAGYGDTGHNEEFGVEEDGRDDMVGTVPIGSWAPDYGMNGSSIGIEMVHVSGSGDYPTAQLEALDNLIAYIDAYYGFESAITDHKAWRTGNSDTSPEFAGYLECYQAMRTHAAR